MDKAQLWTIDYGNPTVFGKVWWRSEANKHDLQTTYNGALASLLSYASQYGNARIRCKEVSIDMKCTMT